MGFEPASNGVRAGTSNKINSYIKSISIYKSTNKLKCFSLFCADKYDPCISFHTSFFFPSNFQVSLKVEVIHDWDLKVNTRLGLSCFV